MPLFSAHPLKNRGVAEKLDMAAFATHLSRHGHRAFKTPESGFVRLEANPIHSFKDALHYIARATSTAIAVHTTIFVGIDRNVRLQSHTLIGTVAFPLARPGLSWPGAAIVLTPSAMSRTMKRNMRQMVC